MHLGGDVLKDALIYGRSGGLGQVQAIAGTITEVLRISHHSVFPRLSGKLIHSSPAPRRTWDGRLTLLQLDGRPEGGIGIGGTAASSSFA